MKINKEELSEITEDILYSGIEKSLINAKELFTEGEILKKHNKFSRAYTLFQFTMEEIGKAVMIFDFLLFEDVKDKIALKKLLNEIEFHKVKIEKVKTIDFMIAFVSKSIGVKKTLISNMNKQKKTEINKWKNYSLYTSLINGNFIIPSEIIRKEVVEQMEVYANIRLIAGQQYLTKENLINMKKAGETIDKNDLLKNGDVFLEEFWNE